MLEADYFAASGCPNLAWRGNSLQNRRDLSNQISTLVLYSVPDLGKVLKGGADGVNSKA